MDWGAVELSLLAVGVVVGAGLCFAFLLSRARSTASRATGVPQHDRAAFEQALAEELERARRHERPLTLVHLPWDAADGADAGAAVLGSVALRRIDRVFPLANGTFLIAPETSAGAKEALLARLWTVCDVRSAATLRAVTFPDDGLSSGALLARLEGPAPSRLPAPDSLPRPERPTTRPTTDRRIA